MDGNQLAGYLFYQKELFFCSMGKDSKPDSAAEPKRGTAYAGIGSFNDGPYPVYH